MERLADALAEVVSARPLSDPFAPEVVVVSGRGMERWLSMELSRRLGVWANAEFPFPRRLIERAFDAVLGGAGDEGRAFEPGALTWSIARALRDYDPTLEEPLREHGYLTVDSRRVERKKPGQPGARRRFQFSKR